VKDHILEFVASGTSLRKKRGLLIVSLEGSETQIPFADISGVMILSEDVHLSSAVLSECLRQGVCIQFLDGKYMPHGLLTPYVGHRLMKARLDAQLRLSENQIRRLWQKVVIKKIQMQASCLEHSGKSAVLLKKFAQEVAPGDEGSHEAQAARKYWSELFGSEFKREPEMAGLNSFLNYGYAVLRSAVARYVVACGLNPSLGIFHKNLENPFCLVDDLMEPFRPLVDFYCREFAEEVELTPRVKRRLVDVLEHRITYRAETKPLRNVMLEYCQNFTKAVCAADSSLFDLGFQIHF